MTRWLQFVFLLLATSAFAYAPAPRHFPIPPNLAGIVMTTTFDATETFPVSQTVAGTLTSTGQPRYQKSADGSTNGWTYYLDGRLATNFFGNGAYWWIQYDDANRTVTRTFCSAGGTPLATNVTGFDRRGNAVAITDAGGTTFTNTFDGLDRLKSTVGPATMTVSATNMDFQNPIYVTNFSQPSFTNYYDAAGAAFTNANALGEKSIARFDALGRTTRSEIRSASGTLVREASAMFAADFNSATFTDGAGATAIATTVFTDTDGQPVLQRAKPSTSVTEFSWNGYDRAGNLTEARRYARAAGVQTLFSSAIWTYDGLQRALTATAGDGAVTAFAYDALGNVTNRTMPGGLQWRASFNSAGQMLQERNVGSGSVATRTNTYAYYTAGSPFAGRLQTQTDGRGVVSTLTYDDWLRVATKTQTGPLDEQDVTTVLQYEARGLLTNVSQAFALSNTGPATVIERSYDAFGRLSSEAVSVGTSNLYSAGQSWDLAGRRTALGLGNGYNFSWQPDRLLKTASFGALGGGTYAYNTAGLLTSRSVGARVTSIGSRDGVGRPLAITTTVNTVAKLTETLAWTGDGMPSAHTLAREDFTDARQFFYANQNRRLIEERLNLDATKRWTNAYTFDNGVASGPGVLTKIGAPNSSSASWSGVTDAFARIGTETNSAARQLAYGRVNGTASITASLDGVPQPVGVINTADPVWSKRWNATLDLTPGVHQLTVSAAHPSGLFTTNATSGFTNNIGSQAVTDTHDSAGNLTQRVWRKPNGTTNLMQTLAWDGLGRLYKVTERDAAQSGRDFSVTYDAFGRRLQTREITVTNGVVLTNQPLVVSHYFDPLVEFLEMGVNENGTTTWKLLGPDMDGTYGGQNGTGGFDAEATALSFAPVVGDAFGNVLARYSGSALTWNSSRLSGYGGLAGYRPLALGSSGSLAAKFAWRNRASECVGLTWLGGNWLDSASGRFISPDPFGHDGSPSLYSFCGGAPVGYQWDADGRLAKGVREGWKESSSEPANSSLAFSLGMAIGGIQGEYMRGLGGGSSITANTLTFGGSDAAGLTESRQYQGTAYTGSRILATVGRESAIAAATLGTAQLARAGSQGALYSYQGLQVVNAGRSGYAIGTGVDQVYHGNNWGYLNIAGGGLGLAGGTVLARSASELNVVGAIPRYTGPVPPVLPTPINITHGVDDLLQSASAPDRGGLTAAGRSLTKHGTGARTGNSVFPTPKGNPAAINQTAKDIVNDILRNPQSVTKMRPGKPGEMLLQVSRPDGGGVMFKFENGKWVFSHFAENLY